MWQELLAVVVPILIAALSACAPIIISWLKTQKIVQKMHFEDLIATMIPQIIAWVEYWAEQLTKQGTKPTSEQKLAKALELINIEVPGVKLTTDIVSRIETELKKTKAEK